MYLAQLVFRHDDAATSAKESRNRFSTPQIFRRLARQGKLSCFGFAEDDRSAQSKSSRPVVGARGVLAPAPARDGDFRL